MITAAVCAQTPDEAAHRIQGLIGRGDFATARKDLPSAIRAAPKEAALYSLQGIVLAQGNDLTGAERSFERAIELAPHFSAAYLNLGHLYQEESKKDPRAQAKALEVYEKLLGFESGNVEAHYQAAVLLFRLGSNRRSIEHLRRLPPQDQEHAQALSVLCADLTALGDTTRAAEAADRLLQSSDLAEADVLSILPVITKTGHQEPAVRVLEGLEARHLAGFNSLQALGLLYKRQGKLDSARSTLEKAMQFQPDSAPVLVGLAQVADQQHDYTGALGYLAHARELDPRNGSIHFLWGMICVEQNLAEEAYRALKQAVNLDPNNAYYNYALGAVAMQRQDAGESIPYFQKYCQLRPQDRRGRLALGVAYFNSHNEEKAQKVMAGLVQFPATAATAHYYLGRIANQKGDSATAVRELHSALRAAPDYADIYAELGLIHLKQKQYSQAEESLQRALRLNPEGYTANLNLLILYRRMKDPRAEAQAIRFDEVKEKRAQRVKEFLRTVEIRP